MNPNKKQVKNDGFSTNDEVAKAVLSVIKAANEKFKEVETSLQKSNDAIITIAQREVISSMDSMKGFVTDRMMENDAAMSELESAFNVRMDNSISKLEADYSKRIDDVKALIPKPFVLNRQELIDSAVQSSYERIVPLIPPKADENLIIEKAKESIVPLIPAAETSDSVRSKIDQSLEKRGIDAKFILNLEDSIDGSKIKNLPPRQVIYEGKSGGFTETALKDATTGRFLSKDASGAWLVPTGSGGSSSSFPGLVTVIHKDGTTNVYNPASNTDASRGTALLTALAACVSGDVVYLTANTFDIGTSGIDLTLGGAGSISLFGSGKYDTIIKCSAQGAGKLIVKAASYSITKNLSLYATDTTTWTGTQFCLPWGNVTTALTNVTIENVYISGRTDGIYLTGERISGGATTAVIRNVTIDSKWDAFFLQDQGRIDIFDSYFNAISNTDTHGGVDSHALYNDDGGTVNVYNTVLIAGNGSTGNWGIKEAASGIVNFYSGSISTSGTAPLDISRDLSGQVNVTSSVVYDVAKTSGVIGYLDANQLSYSLGSLSSNKRILYNKNGVVSSNSVFVFDDTPGGESLGIGVASPTHDLDIQGNLGIRYTDGVTGYAAHLMEGDFDSATWNLQLGNFADANTVEMKMSQPDGTIVFRGGDVGIATTSPRGRFDVNDQHAVPTPGATSGVTFTYNGSSTGNYQAAGNTFGFKIFAYISGAWSATPLSITGTDNGSNDPMIVTANWAAVTGATSYRVFMHDDWYTGADYTIYFDTSSTSFSVGDPSDNEDNMTGGDMATLVPTSYGPNFYVGENNAAYVYALNATNVNATNLFGDGLNITSVFHPGHGNLDMGGYSIVSFNQIGTISSPSYKADIRGGSASQLHFSNTTSSDNGGYLTSAGAGNFFMSSGASYSGTGWVARNAAAAIIGGGPSNDGVLTFYTNSALTYGVGFSPTERFRIDDSNNFTFRDASKLVFGTTTGVTIGTSTSQKIGFWNTTPIVQPTTAVSAATFVANTSANPAFKESTYDGYTTGQVVKALRNLGILA